MLEYLSDINQSLKTISEKDVKYINIYKTEGILYGAPNWDYNKSFSKFTPRIDAEMNSLTDKEFRTYIKLGKNTSGCFLRFRTDSNIIIIKAHVRRKYDFGRLTLNNSSGFDVYEVDDEGNYYHKKIIACRTGENIFADQIIHNKDREVHIYLPASNEIEALYIGAKKRIRCSESVKEPPIIFYGNSITQGGSASRSGNTFCNIISRRLDNEIYNLSVSMCCKGFGSVAKYIGKFNARAIVIDFTRNADNVNYLEMRYQKFYDILREYHKDTKIILMDTSNYNDDIHYNEYNQVVYETYNKSIEMGHNTYLLKQRDLFNEDEYDLATVDGIHYTDYGMYKIADAICELIVADE